MNQTLINIKSEDTSHIWKEIILNNLDFNRSLHSGVPLF